MARFMKHTLILLIAFGFIFILSGFTRNVDGLNGSLSKDKSPPSVTLSISSPTGKNGWYNKPVSVVVRAFDGQSGIAKRQVSIGGTVWYENALTLRQDGTYRVYGRAVDKAGNAASTSVLVKIDMTLPELKFSIPDPKGYKDWYVNPVPVKLSGTDELSGMADTHLLIEGDSMASKISPWDSQEAFNEEDVRDYQQIILGENINTSLTQASIEDSGVYHISGYVEDMAGNRTTIDKTIKIDMTPPMVAIDSPRKFFGKISVEGSVLDYESGVNKIFVDTGEGWNDVKATEDGSWQIEWVTDELRDGKYLIQAKVVDFAGNQSFSYYTATVLNNIWPIFAFMGVLLSFGILAMYDPRREAWLGFTEMLAKYSHMEKNAMKLKKELR